MNPYGYADAVWQRFQATPHAGRIPGVQPAVSRNAAGEPVLMLQWDGQQARFLAHGCPVTIAVGEWLCEQLEAIGVEAVRQITATDIRQALEIPDDKAHIALMAEDVVKRL